MQLNPRMLLAVVVVNVLAGILVISARATTQKSCDDKQEQWFQQAEAKDWDTFYNRFKRFGDCDDGAIAEGFSETVAQLFLKQWTHLDTLSHLAVADKRFEQFVLRHTDATLSEDELKGIIENSRLRCPTGEKGLCELVRTKADRSLIELRKSLK